MDLKLIEKILKEAMLDCRSRATTIVPEENKKKLHSQWSSAWVEKIADGLRNEFPESEGYRVFSRGYKENKKSFLLSEYLFDVTVIKVAEMNSASGKAKLEFPEETILHVESEFQSNDSRASIVDFGKLLMSAAENKLLILPSGGRIEAWAKQELARISDKCTGDFYLAFVPHPREWADEDKAPEVQLQKCRI